MASLLEEILGEKEGALPPEPVKPEKTGDFWTDLKNQYNYNDAMTRYNEQVGMASQRPFSEHMKVAEFRPASARERKLARLAKIAERSKYSSNRIAALPAESAEKAKQKILSEFKPEDWSLQVEEMAGGWPKTQIYDEITQGKISKRLENQRTDDLLDIGYSKADVEALKKDRGGISQREWEKINKVYNAKDPEYVYHRTQEKNLENISKKGLLSQEETKNQVYDYPYQSDKVFFSTKPEESMYPSPNRTIRTKYRKDMFPDAHQESTGAWYQTDEMIPAKDLEIETTPGQWEALLDYIRKGGK